MADGTDRRHCTVVFYISHLDPVAPRPYQLAMPTGDKEGLPISYSYSIVGALVWNHSIPNPKKMGA